MNSKCPILGNYFVNAFLNIHENKLSDDVVLKFCEDRSSLFLYLFFVQSFDPSNLILILDLRMILIWVFYLLFMDFDIGRLLRVFFFLRKQFLVTKNSHKLFNTY